MAMNENKKNKGTIPAGTLKNSGRYPWVQDEGLTEIEAMGNALLELEDELNSVVEDLHLWFGHHGIEELGTLRKDLDHINEVLRPRIECQHSSIKAQYNKKLKQLNELANAYAGLIEKNTELEEDCKRHADDCSNTAQLCAKLQTELKNEQDRAESDRVYLKKQITALHLRNCQIHDKCNDLLKKLNTTKNELAEMKESFETARKLYLKETEKNEKLAEQVDARDNHIGELQGALENCEERIYELESELEYEQDDTRYDRGYRHGSEELYDALKIMINMIRRGDDFYKVFDIEESATDDDIVKLFDQMSAEDFLKACRNYRNQIIREIKVGDEIVDLAHGDHMIVIEVNDDSYKCVVRLAQPPVHRQKKICSKTGRHYLHVPFDYDGRERG